MVIHGGTSQDQTASNHQSTSRGSRCEVAFLVRLIDQIQVTKLCGPEPWTKYLVLAVFSLQTICAVSLRKTPILSPTFVLVAYVVGATANQNLFLAIHEISHNLAFKSPLANRLIAIFANLPIGLPYSAAFRVGFYILFLGRVTWLT